MDCHLLHVVQSFWPAGKLEIEQFFVCCWTRFNTAFIIWHPSNGQFGSRGHSSEWINTLVPRLSFSGLAAAVEVVEDEEVPPPPGAAAELEERLVLEPVLLAGGRPPAFSLLI